MAKNLRIENLLEINVKHPKSKLHELFLWCLEVVYGETSQKYYFENFRKVAFVKDHGVDFKLRIENFDTSKMGSSEA